MFWRRDRDPALDRLIDRVGRQDVADHLASIGWSLSRAPDRVVRGAALDVQEHKRFAASVIKVAEAQAAANRESFAASELLHTPKTERE